MKRTVCILLVALAVVGIADSAEESAVPTLGERLATIRSVAHGYPPRLDGPDHRARIEALWRDLEKGLLAYSETHDSDANGHILLGDLYCMGHNLDIKDSGPRAVEHLERAATLDPANPKPYYLLGRHFTYADEAEKGQIALLKAYARAEPATHPAILFDLTFNSYFRRDFATAILFAERYLVGRPDEKAIAFLRDKAREAMAGREIKTIHIEAEGPPEGKLETVKDDQLERKP